MNNLTLVIPLIVSGISAVVSITSIFVSNWLGRKTQLKQAKYEHKKEIYLSLYVPLLKWFHASNFMEKKAIIGKLHSLHILRVVETLCQIY